MKKIVLAIVLFVASTAVHAQDTAYVRSIISTLSSPQMYGRGSSYHGDSLAAQFLASEMRRLGVLPLQVDYLQHYTYPCYSFSGPVSLNINGQPLQPYVDYRVFSAARHAKPEKLARASWKKQAKDGTWIYAVDKLDTYSPIVGPYADVPVCVQVLKSALPRKVKNFNLSVPVAFQPQYHSQNVVGYIPGVVDTMIVFTAHYDHCGIMGDSVLFPGAHDNASGTAAVLDLARMASQSQPYYTLVFMLFSGEESGLLGSHHAAENPLINYTKVKLLCNIDMFCGGDEGLMVFNANSESTQPFYQQLVEQNNILHAAREIRPRDNSANSDHYWFSRYCPSIFLLTMGKPYGGYHDPYDTCQACGLNHYIPFMTLIKSLAQLP